jgi:hypothetical protein
MGLQMYTAVPWLLPDPLIYYTAFFLLYLLLITPIR